MQQDLSYDHVVIGGGHNGLVAACYLAQAGQRVALVEQRPYLGGMAASQPHVAAAPQHVLSQGAIDAVFLKTTPIVQELGLAQHGFRLIDIEAGYGWTDSDGATLCIFNDMARTVQDIARFSQADARCYVDLQNAFKALLKVQLPLFGKAATDIGKFDLVKAGLSVLGDRGARQALAKLASGTAYEAIAASFESDALRSLYAYWCEIAGPCDVDGSGLSLASLAVIHQVGCARPVGSMGGLMAVLARCLQHHDGVVHTGVAVEQILVDGQRARGVRLADGRELLARRSVLASCAPQLTYGRLLAPEHQSANSRARVPFLPANANNMCPFKVDVAVGGRLRFGKAQRQRDAIDGFDIGATSLMTGSFDDHLEHAAALRLGRMGQRSPSWMTVLSHADRSIAPEGQDVAYLYTSAPMQPAEGWAAQAGPVADALMQDAARYLDGLDATLGRCVTTPADFEQQYSTPRGSLYHVDMLPTRMFTQRPATGMGGSATEVAGLYLAGSGSHPGGGVFGMPGRLAARAALGDKR